jgi:hypothetical protein
LLATKRFGHALLPASPQAEEARELELRGLRVGLQPSLSPLGSAGVPPALKDEARKTAAFPAGRQGMGKASWRIGRLETEVESRSSA